MALAGLTDDDLQYMPSVFNILFGYFRYFNIIVIITATSIEISAEAMHPNLTQLSTQLLRVCACAVESVAQCVGKGAEVSGRSIAYSDR